MRTVKLLIGLLALMLVLASCQSQSEGKAENMENPQYKIGVHFELTGGVADYGNPEKNGALLAIKQANEKAGYEKYVPVVYDNKSDTTEAVTIATRLVSDKVIGVVGPATSGASAATYQVLNDAKILVVSPSATQNNITRTNPDDASSAVYEYVFRVCFEDSYQGKAMAHFAYKNLNLRKAALYSDNSNDYSKGIVKAFEEAFKELGGQVLANEYYTANDTDFASVLTKLKALDIDSIYVAGYYAEAGLIIKQAKEMGINVTFLGGDGFDSEVLVELATAENLNNVYYTTGYTTVNASDALKAFIEAYSKDYSNEPSLFAALAYDATNTLIQAIEQGGSQTADFQQNLLKGSYSGVTGSYTFDESHTPIKSVLVVELVNGVQENATPVTTK